MKKKVLFVTHKKARCGVYEFGVNIFEAIKNSSMYEFIHRECDSLSDLKAAISETKSELIIYNYHPAVLPWICTKVSKGLYKNHVASIPQKQIGIIHEVTQSVADTATNYRNRLITGQPSKKLNSLFDFYIAPDPTLLLYNPIVFKTGRLIPRYDQLLKVPQDITIGSFGFATPNKGFESLVKQVVKEFDKATIRLNMPFASFGDEDGNNARHVSDNCRKIVEGTNIRLDISHEYLSSKQLLDFLASNSLNAFFYDDQPGRGISSVTDYALAVDRPLVITKASMFRHLFNLPIPITTDKISLKEGLHNGTGHLADLKKEWDSKNILWEYERIIQRAESYTKPRLRKGIKRRFKDGVRSILTRPSSGFSWLRNTSRTTDDSLEPVNTTYNSVSLGENKLNRILDDSARDLYKPAIKKLFELVPQTMAKKIERANVQQGFVFDTVFRYVKKPGEQKILCVGSYEDTASMSLIKMGYHVDEIDPMINYFLQEFATKPTVEKKSYDLIFSTSVIEHDPDDESFIKAIDHLLAPGGTAIVTCDYKDGWKKGDPLPEVDARFYTKDDLEKRLLSYSQSLKLVDVPEWDCPNPDFLYQGKYQYTFATFVVTKA